MPPQSSSDLRIFERRPSVRKQKQTCQGPMTGLPPYQTRGRWVPPTLRTVGALSTQKGKSEKFLISSIPAAHAQQTPANTTPTVKPPAVFIKYPQTFDPCFPSFLQGRENIPNFGPNYDQNHLRTAVFLNCGIISENKTNMVRANARPIIGPCQVCFDLR